jgi:hypothetical protein
MWALVAVIFVAAASTLRPYLALVRGYGDTGSYMQIAHAIRTWDFSELQVKQFWGLPYAVALLSKLTGLPEETSILAVCAASSLMTLVFAHRLWGGWIAVFISILNVYWVQLSFLGGSEPSFVALLLGSLLLIRKERWYLATLLASFATITRPLGMCLLLGIGVCLLWRRLAGAVGIGGAIGILYVLPIKLYLHDPLATVHSYGVLQASSSPGVFGILFRAIIVGTLSIPALGRILSSRSPGSCLLSPETSPWSQLRNFAFTRGIMSRKPSSSGYICFSSTHITLLAWPAGISRASLFQSCLLSSSPCCAGCPRTGDCSGVPW